MGTLHYDLPNHVKTYDLYPTAFSPLGGPLCPHKKKKKKKTYDLKKLENFKKIPEMQATQRVNSDMC